MLILFDNGTPRTLARFLIDRHTVTEARARPSIPGMLLLRPVSIGVVHRIL